MKWFNTTTQAYVDVPRTDSANGFTNRNGYMTFVRGDRGATHVLATGTSTTTLRSSGAIYTGTQSAIPVAGDGFGSFGNPYPSAIDMRLLNKTGLQEFIYLWDPKLGGNYGLGAFETFSFNGTNYESTVGGGSYGAGGDVYNAIQSGQAFFMHATDGTGGSLTFMENTKISGSRMVFRENPQTLRQLLRGTVYSITTAGVFNVQDGFRIDFDSRHNDKVDYADALKMENLNENFAVVKDNKFLIIERRTPVRRGDTIYLSLRNVRLQEYRLQFTLENMGQNNVEGYLVDKYMNRKTLLDLNGVTPYSFRVENVVASYDPNRFYIVFEKAKQIKVHPRAAQQKSDITVDWDVEGSVDVVSHDIMHSTDGVNFEKLVNIPGQEAKGVDPAYTWLHSDVKYGDHYYKIRTIDRDGEIYYSKTVMVKMQQSEEGRFVVYPNPVVNREMHLQVFNKPAGRYVVELFNSSGVKVATRNFQHSGGNTEWIIKSDKLAAGNYQIVIKGPAESKSTQKLLLQ
jgi:hypothetical protein